MKWLKKLGVNISIIYSYKKIVDKLIKIDNVYYIIYYSCFFTHSML